MRFSPFMVTVLLTACVTTPPIPMEGTEKELTPDRALSDIESAKGRRVAWGGAIISTRNLKDATEIEVLGYPLKRDGRPDLGTAPQRRFLIVREGYLEPADYRNGRQISAVGAVNGVRKGVVGEAPYVYAVLQAEQVHLWPIEETRRDSNVHFGVGVGVILGR